MTPDQKLLKQLQSILKEAKIRGAKERGYAVVPITVFQDAVDAVWRLTELEK